jgi:Sec-independent protein translocase protein TatA
MFHATTLAIGMPQGFEWIFIAAIGLLIFGKRLRTSAAALVKASWSSKRD